MTDSYVSLDLETTGLNPGKDKIIEIGCVKVKEGKVCDTFSTLIHPGVLLGDKAKELTGIREEELVSAPLIQEVLPSLLDFLEDLPLLGHRILFDYSFLKRAVVNEKCSFEKNGIDTLMLARTFLKNLESRKLEDLCQYYHIEHKAHRALADAYATHELYRRLLTEFLTGAPRLFEPKPLKYQVKKESPVTNHQKERLYELIKKHKIEPEYEVELLTRNEASRYTDKILSTYGR